MLNKLVLENLRHRPVRTSLSVFAIGVEVTMMLTLVGLSNGTLDETARRLQGVGADIVVRKTALFASSSATMDQGLVPLFLSQPHVVFATGTVIQPLAFMETLTGLDMAEFDKLSGGFRFVQGGPFRGDDDVIVSDDYAHERSIHVGNVINLANHDWRVSGIFESGKLANVCVKLEVLQSMAAAGKKLSQIYLKLDDPNQAKAVAGALHKKFPDYNIITMKDAMAYIMSNPIGLLRNFIKVVIGIAVVVGFIVVFMAMYTAVLERTREIGILKSLGASAAYILNLLFRETLLIAVAGTVLGIAMTFGTQWLMKHAVPSSLTQETAYAWWPTAAAIAIAGALLGAVFPAVKALKQDAIEALSYE